MLEKLDDERPLTAKMVDGKPDRIQSPEPPTACFTIVAPPGAVTEVEELLSEEEWKRVTDGLLEMVRNPPSESLETPCPANIRRVFLSTFI